MKTSNNRLLLIRHILFAVLFVLRPLSAQLLRLIFGFMLFHLFEIDILSDIVADPFLDSVGLGYRNIAFALLPSAEAVPIALSSCIGIMLHRALRIAHTPHEREPR